MKKVIVYGGCGSLGRSCVDSLIKNKYWVLSIGHSKNDFANANVVVKRDITWTNEEEFVRSETKNILSGDKVDAIFCCAGGWAGGGIKSKNMIKSAELVWKQSVFTSSISATLAYDCLKENGLLILTSAKSIKSGTPFMIGYGMAKAAVLHLSQSLADEKSNMPLNSRVISILPDTLDTEMNRKNMPNGDFTKWTPLNVINDKIIEWIEKEESRPVSGSEVYFETENNQTTVVVK